MSNQNEYPRLSRNPNLWDAEYELHKPEQQPIQPLSQVYPPSERQSSLSRNPNLWDAEYEARDPDGNIKGGRRRRRSARRRRSMRRRRSARRRRYSRRH